MELTNIARTIGSTVVAGLLVVALGAGMGGAVAIAAVGNGALVDPHGRPGTSRIIDRVGNSVTIDAILS
ncbi:hypothetical protein AB0395_41095 [Streptosporangium sp. NPDC051023]|uniref:hypothetical protein n=1 Tax=Streptosporangium sp. NPDC051023 TaxID=3155410 RepID=UPI00345093E0